IVMDSENNLYLTDGANQILRKGVSFLVPTAPVYQKVQPGTPVSLCVGSGDFAYQWLFDGEVLSGQTNPVLEIGPLVRTNSGIYSVVVRNGMSNSVMLSAAVQARFPTVLQPPQRLDSGVMRLLFQASDGGLPFDFSSVQLQWRNTLPTETDTNWNVSWASQTVTNGFVLIEDTSATAQTNRFYRVVEP
ncbi:MAG TPA: immunoglobulin domain-containing protein, partial [Clostridia bacterium]|nr:immunoglobulin domain-containing protein [Clostridia bacterium]